MLHRIVTSTSVLILHHRDAHPTAAELRRSGRLLARLTGALLGFALLLTARSIPASSTAPLATTTVPPPAYGGAMILKRSVGELTTEADCIVVADVLAIESQFNADRSSINTQVTLAVDKVLKGKAKAQETLTLPGGQVGDYGVLVGGVPNFIAGERVLLFLEDGSEFAIAGMWQGKYSLSGDEAFQPETGRKVSVASLEREISQALTAPVQIGTSPEVVYAQYTLWNNCNWDPNDNSIYPIAHYINPNNPGNGAPTGASFVSLMYDSLYAWQDLPNSWVLLRVAGTTTRPATDHFDENNDIAWADLDYLSTSTLGVNSCAYDMWGHRIDSDTRFDNTGTTWTITAEAGKIDLPSVSEHELGHGIGLDHSNQFCDGTAATPLMCSYVNAGVRKNILTDDSNGAAALYPLSGLVPAAPSGLSVSAAGNSSILSWTDSSSNELAFEIQRASGSCAGPFTGAATVPANTTTYTDDDYGVGLSGSYCYRVKALNRGGDSGFSNTALRCVDAYEDDDLVGNAQSINTIGVAQHRNFHDSGDKDWAKFDVKGNVPYTITTSVVGATDTWLYLYEPDGTTEITNNDDCPGGGKESCIYWTAPTTDTYFIRVHQFSGAGDCSGYEYDLTVVGNVERVYLPLILKNSP